MILRPGPASTVFVLPVDPVCDHKSEDLDANVKALTPEGGANFLLISVDGANVKYTLRGTPTATNGHTITAGDPAVLIPIGPNVTAVQIIRLAAGARIQYSWCR